MPDWTTLNDSPIYVLVDRPTGTRPRRFVYRPELQDRDDRGDGAVFERHHIIPNTVYEDFRLDEFWLGLGQGYNQWDSVTNRVFLPTQQADALRLGAATHNSQGQGNNHLPYNEFVRSLVTQISNRAQQDSAVVGETAAYEQALKDIRGLQQWLKWALQATAPDGRPLLALNDADPRLADRWTLNDIYTAANEVIMSNRLHDDLTSAGLLKDHDDALSYLFRAEER